MAKKVIGKLLTSLISKSVRVYIMLLFCQIESVFGQVQLSPQEANLLAIEKTTPEYPSFLAEKSTQSTVKIQITVSETGEVISTKVVSSNTNPFALGEALKAAKKYKYKPHVVNGKPALFVTTIDIVFSAGIPAEEYEQELQIAQKYFAEDDKCRELLKTQNWRKAEMHCKKLAVIADKLPERRSLEKSSAYEYVGRAMMGQRRYQEALSYFTRAFDAGKVSLKETDAELGYAYTNLALANHGLGNLQKAREHYAKAVKILLLALDKIDDDDLEKEYLKNLKQILKYYLTASEEAGAVDEAKEIRERMSELP